MVNTLSAVLISAFLLGFCLLWSYLYQWKPDLSWQLKNLIAYKFHPAPSSPPIQNSAFTLLWTTLALDTNTWNLSHKITFSSLTPSLYLHYCTGNIVKLFCREQPFPEYFISLFTPQRGHYWRLNSSEKGDPWRRHVYEFRPGDGKSGFKKRSNTLARPAQVTLA